MINIVCKNITKQLNLTSIVIENYALLTNIDRKDDPC